ncbi:hypothetical protein OVA24_12730 [Luteolibacter sp. SL250]|uniref:hypothetical protein n=1 Tax=Luteolibacter sp. SL250 TaxID=2995170 RepID=UPI00226F1EE6|nr:hypothetical protein [Luteolibacter sp. SL250]WAC18103.1 hypothetical protein OVA24_12730 [Luteolibacter sp. SL250]
MKPIKRCFSALMRNPWLPLFIGIPFLAMGWLAANYVLPMGEDYHGLFALSISTALIGSTLLGFSLFRGDWVIRILAVLFLLTNWKIATKWIDVEPWLPRTAVYSIPPPKVSVVDSRPEMKHRDDSMRIVLVDSVVEVSFNEHRFPADLLVADQSYRFTFEETPHHYDSPWTRSENGMITVMGQRHPPEPPDIMWMQEILTIQREGVVIFDRTVCEVHHEKMERRDLPISYGYPDLRSFPSPSLERDQFPHWREYVLGGCCVIDDVKTSREFVCGKCVAALKKWESENIGSTR